MNKTDTACEYLESMARKYGVEAAVYPSGGKQNTFTMCRKGAYPTEPRVTVSLEESRDSFACKCRKLMEASRI